ncbi:hypothetical protein COC42_08620 [Sphingomonas spermidinifaciens]|uniref:DUF1134 domain-containing protein n=1 Tax=Sphingomonas spermidinifaciens TaxID=1141889 RepID=A0A2A4B9I9_9SPHN|nr:DUF1134 domain-containing protein [Sphingomonas spermidinifaciens]PCD04326.1 hypothetical protein COC42_08620 [Sphingomonas spermidinifaciens]
MAGKWLIALASAAMAAAPLSAQVRTIDPNSAIDADLNGQTSPPAQAPLSQDEMTVDPGPQEPVDQAPPPAAAPVTTQAPAPTGAPVAADRTAAAEETFARDDLMSAAEGVFGKGAQGLAGMLEKLLSEQGRPNAYIAGREASGAFVVGVRYGSGIMTHRVEGQRPVYWTGPSLGFDVGGDANKVFVLVYNLYDSQELYRRFPAAEGRVYFVGGFAATYLRRGDVVLIPIRLGVGWRLGANVGYMNFTEKSKWLPF